VYTKTKSVIERKKEEKNSANLKLEVLKNKYYEEEINEVIKLFRGLESMKAKNDKETFEYIKEFLNIPKELKKTQKNKKKKKKIK